MPDITVPLLEKAIGLGDALKAATSAAGVKPCGGCQKRAALLNAVRFVPRGAGFTASQSAEWTKPPEMPSGWKFIKSMKSDEKHLAMFRSAGAFIIWEIRDGEYRNSHSFCATCPDAEKLANARWDEMCR